MKDLFETPEKLPLKVQKILDKYASKELDYKDCEDFLNELKPMGYKFEYYLDTIPFNLKPLKTLKP